jgi:hypothetical protein
MYPSDKLLHYTYTTKSLPLCYTFTVKDAILVAPYWNHFQKEYIPYICRKGKVNPFCDIDEPEFTVLSVSKLILLFDILDIEFIEKLSEFVNNHKEEFCLKFYDIFMNIPKLSYRFKSPYNEDAIDIKTLNGRTIHITCITKFNYIRISDNNTLLLNIEN